MKKLYAPWRSSYTTDTTRGKHDESTAEDCAFCIKFRTQDDSKSHILARFKHHAVLLNLYPYNAGHLLIIPYEHVKNLDDLSPESRVELMELVTRSVNIVKETLNAEGVNVGLNLGKAAGAGIPSHLHWHVLPRWNGDTNFLPLLADTKAVSYDLEVMYKKLVEPFQKLVLKDSK
jgi:ATP adenylyltransferase